MPFTILMHNVPIWPDTLKRSCSICCKISKVCLTILGLYALKGSTRIFPTVYISKARY